MKPADYINAAHVTASPNFYGNLVSRGTLRRAVLRFMASADELDAIKKALFYGRPFETGVVEVERNCDGIVSELAGNRVSEEKAMNSLHAAIGIATESGEMLAPFYKAIFEGVEFDAVNSAEETGDVLWYIALALRAGDKTFEGMFIKNIEKLRARYGDKFSDFDALNRDLAAERVVLESNHEAAEIDAAVFGHLPPFDATAQRVSDVYVHGSEIAEVGKAPRMTATEALQVKAMGEFEQKHGRMKNMGSTDSEKYPFIGVKKEST